VYTYFKSLSSRELLTRQLPTLTLSLIASELFFKFHSFTLECVAFLATWYAFDLIAGSVFALFPRKGVLKENQRA
jgi:hypothetical protein